MLMRLAWTGPPAPAHYTHTGWDTCPASIASLAPLALKYLLSATRIYQSLGNISKSICRNRQLMETSDTTTQTQKLTLSADPSVNQIVNP